ncbi:hypothetical protein L484_009168 [Morus notabilis]|uniref:Uncharacterized protein n=1 Tax=Morus notabilis TaxID=981085 RepID=W9R9N4_9ROSA|nr:hypothetical protein L484_009168 [Morus notabilis]
MALSHGNGIKYADNPVTLTAISLACLSSLIRVKKIKEEEVPILGLLFSSRTARSFMWAVHVSSFRPAWVGWRRIRQFGWTTPSGGLVIIEAR